MKKYSMTAFGNQKKSCLKASQHWQDAGNPATNNATWFLEAGSVQSLVIGSESKTGLEWERFKHVTFAAVEFTLKLHPTQHSNDTPLTY